MGSVRLTLCTGILAAAVLAPAPAHAADTGSVSVTPAAPAPGTDVGLRVRGCYGRQGTAVSPAFVSDARLTGGQGSLSGETRVRSSLKPGAYDVKVTCADYVISGRITVGDRGTGAGRGTGSDRGTVGDRGAGTDRGTGTDTGTGSARGTGAGRGSGQSAEPGRKPADGASPVAPVRAGGGGTAHFATVATTESGPDTVQAVTGLALAGIAVVAVGLRARRSRDPR
ncbi:hypothetical protein [Streptomyces roseochromogenus]|uniref:Gram-positive cocci surface proteins LPxTG domain-containing protein n=1 Tax=Streptomyces roseochromogenus subsp. oscitans DS 12.976 TaxID=1352936 RepID=V6K013_STRRC|nr:hypothetical protein [Streptomyces roseochromogenus]EST25585.1 hypothetical protein M878_28585 [Streptomyces roseochromogenus subsp. oscitans DS 12.976]